MPETRTLKIHLRGFVSLLTSFSFLVMAISGIILFVVPQGRIASWINWQIWGLTKTQWGDIHISTSLLFIVAGLWHTWINWRSLISYFRDKTRKTIALKRELLISLLLTLFFTVGAIYKTPPVSYLLALNDNIKEFWIQSPEDEPPIAHAELLPLSTFLHKEDIELEPALAALKKQGIVVTSPEQKLGEIALRNNTSPAALFKLLNQNQAPAQPQNLTLQTPQKPDAAAKSNKTTVNTWTPELIQNRFEGKGIGRKTITDICTELHLDQTEVIARLSEKNIVAKPHATLKQVASENNEVPLAILQIVLVGQPINE